MLLFNLLGFSIIKCNFVILTFSTERCILVNKNKIENY